PEADRAADPQIYDDGLAWQARHFQLEVGLVPDAMIGPMTRSALRGFDGDRTLRLQQSLDQPDVPTKGRVISVNLAAGMLSALEDGREVISSRIVFGKKDTQTPTFSARVDAVWLNPSWIVPDSIVQKEFGGNAHTEKPGPNNPLGPLLLELPNRYEVFLHYTNEPWLFERDARTFSHGCVRVQEAEALSRWLLGEDRWASEAIDAGLMKLATRRFVVDPTVPVYIGYRTVTVASTGAIIYHPDPYDMAQPPPPPEADAAPDGPLAPVTQSAAAPAAPTPH
ncbi:MAG TPA: L,D-transpeptidase family protein, partial [Stellaceae bacterium]|nr:L,D-transpeptidase family protein [Stellaceae bacterium]